MSRLRRALPSPGEALIGAVGWALVMAVSAFLRLFCQRWQTPEKYVEVALLFGLGGALAFPAGLLAARLAACGRSRQAAFAAAFLGLALATFGFTAIAFALDYRQYYATWHAEAFSLRWAFEFFFTSVGAFVQFAVLGSRLFFPLGFVALFVAALWFARSPR